VVGVIDPWQGVRGNASDRPALCHRLLHRQINKKMKLILLGIIFAALTDFSVSWEIWNDRKGDPNKSADVWFRALIFVTVGVTEFFLCRWIAGSSSIWILPAAANFCLAWFFLTFDYRIAAILIDRKIVETKGAHWFSYLGTSGPIDKIKAWRQAKPWPRFFIRFGYFVLSFTIYLYAFKFIAC
jgi:hypothetical protein